MSSSVTTSADVKSVEITGAVTCGPETAAKLGVPAGTVVDLGVLAAKHSNPLKRLDAWRRRYRGNFGEVN